jgi:hypothetical protein
MKVINRIARFEKLVPFDEVEELRCDAWNEGWQDGYRNGMAAWFVVAGVSGLVGLLVGLIST